MNLDSTWSLVETSEPSLWQRPTQGYQKAAMQAQWQTSGVVLSALSSLADDLDDDYQLKEDSDAD